MKNNVLRKMIVKLHFITLVLISLNFSSINGQVAASWQGDGKYLFNNNFPASDLHFYLFDDGYHSFEKSPTHQYNINSIPAFPILFHSEPYDDADDPEEFVFTNIDDGAISAAPPSYQFSNQIELKRSWNLVEDKENYFLLMFENSSSNENISGCVEFHYNKNDIDIDVNQILDDYGNNWVQFILVESSEYSEYTSKIKWEFENLAPLEQRFIYIPGKCIQDVFSEVNTRGVMKIDDCEKIIGENSKTDGSIEEIFDSEIFTLQSFVSNFPHDPNYIVTYPNCLHLEDGVQTVKYKVVFQNDGINEVEDVTVNIRTHGTVKYENIKLLNASHSCALNWDLEEFEILFNNIFLPGMGEDPSPDSIDETIGWVELEICFNIEYNDVNPVGCINTDGEITFDGQSPVQVLNELCRTESCRNNSEIIEDEECPTSEYYQSFTLVEDKLILQTIENQYEPIKLNPNISTDFIHIENLDENIPIEISIYSVISGLLKEIVIFKGEKINIEDLSNGLYYISYKNKSLPFVKI